VSAVCKRVAAKTGIPVLGVHSEGFKGTKKDGYRAACEAVYTLIGTGDTAGISPHSINILGEFNIAGETWIIRDYYKRMGIEVVATITGDARRRHPPLPRREAEPRSMLRLDDASGQNDGARPRHSVQARFLLRHRGHERRALRSREIFRRRSGIMERAQQLVREEIAAIYPELRATSKSSSAKRRRSTSAARSRRFRCPRPAVARHGNRHRRLADRRQGGLRQLQEMCDPGTIIVDDSNPLELAKFCLEKDVDLFIGGVKERPIAYKLGIGFAITTTSARNRWPVCRHVEFRPRGPRELLLARLAVRTAAQPKG
jgi:nitrogenase molybdenum-cofactor synthesis protein NifE